MNPFGALIDDAEVLVDLMEAKTGLKHRRHAVTLKKIRNRLQRLLAAYFERQSVAVLREIESRIKDALEMYPAPQPKFQESGGEWVTINGHPVLIGGDEEDKSDRMKRATKSATNGGN